MLLRDFLPAILAEHLRKAQRIGQEPRIDQTSPRSLLLTRARATRDWTTSTPTRGRTAASTRNLGRMGETSRRETSRHIRQPRPFHEVP